MAQITITNISKTSIGNYSVEFEKDFSLVDLFYEISLDGINWQSPIQLTSFISPQTISIQLLVNFNLRLSSNYTAPTPINPIARVHTNVFTNTFN
jgi:hypothetical protein